jgi:type II secretory pathway pseudopilin PulG
MHRRKNSDTRNREAGYTLMMVVFMVASVLVLASAVVPNLLTQGRRERETELAWRGRQYARAIGLYYTKLGRYPSKIDDLTKQTNGVRFLRQAYSDPMNKEDGSWRFIYVGPNGQLIGSLKKTSLLQSVLSTATLPGTLNPQNAGQNSNANGPGGANGQFSLGTGVSAGGATNSPAGLNGQSSNNALSANPLESQPQPLSGTVIGGSIIGVGSKMKEPSLRVYDGGDRYELWEFIWNPMQQVAVPGQAPAGPAAPAAPGLNPQTAPAPGPNQPGVINPQNPTPPSDAPPATPPAQ